jgi:hypothetical protein
MAERIVCKLDIAKEYLDAAIEFFLERRNYFCAIHLASAAEELLGAHLPENERISELAWRAEKTLRSETGPAPSDSEARRSVNKWKNEVKHMNNGFPTLVIDEAPIAEWHIEEALVNYYKLNLTKTAAIWNFEGYQNERIDKLAEAASAPG